MNIADFYHICRSAAAIADVDEVTVFGSGAVIPWIARHCVETPVWQTSELDIDPGGQELVDLVNSSIGKGSLFEETFQVYPRAIVIDAWIAPPDWASRSEIFEEPSMGVAVRVPNPIDLTVSKLLRGERRDWEFARFCQDRFRLSRDRIAAGLRLISQARPDQAEAVERALAGLKENLGAAAPSQQGGSIPGRVPKP